MTKITKYLCIVSLFFLQWACAQPSLQQSTALFKTGAQQFNEFLPLLANQRIALVVNHTATVGKTHLVDSLLSHKVNIVKIFGPEHGFRGTASDGEKVDNTIDSKTNIPLISLYGKNTRPTDAQLADIDLVLFDIQDVGVRFYTYPTTMHYIMEACAKLGKKLIVFDRPNPNGHLIEGPVLQKKYQSMVGWNPVPVLHGLTMGELALMINGEGWLNGGAKCDLTIIPNQNYTHNMRYNLPIAPSPNLPNSQAIKLYAALCLFEGMDASVGRGTDTQFQVIGAPNVRFGRYTFTPEPKPGSINPPLKGQKCYGVDLRNINADNLGFSLKYVIDFLKKSPNKEKFINNPKHFDRLAGTETLRLDLLAGKTEKQIKARWKNELEQYKILRKKYLLYKDF